MKEKETLYARWLEGKITDEEAEALKKSGEWAELEAIARATDGWSVPAYDAAAGYAKFTANRPNKTAKIRTLRPRWVMGIAASLLLIAVAVFLFRNAGTTVEAQLASSQSVTLPSGSKVVLNDGSKVVFDENDWNAERRVQLTGEAYFEVEKGAPFVVKTVHGTVEVLGTGFNVRAWGGQFLVECYHGKVRVANGKKEVILIKNQSVKMLGAMVQEQAIDHDQPIWTRGSSRFQEDLLVQVFEEMERQYAVKIDFSGNQYRQFSGSFGHDDLEGALKAVCLPMGLDFEINEEAVRVFEK